MSSTTIAAALAILALVAGPAVAGDHDLETELQDSGRYIGQVIPGGSYGWSVKPPPARHGFSAWPTDFQMQGR